MSTVAVAAWIGAGNLGDELIASVTVSELRRVGFRPLLLSLDPDATKKLHRVDAVHHLDVGAWLRAADGLVFGGGGLIQDRTSLLSPWYQLHRPLLARLARMPVLGIGLGAEPVTRPTRALVGAALAGATEVHARDRRSRQVLEACGLRGVVVSADLAFLLDPPPAPGDGNAIIVSLAPPVSRGGLLPSWSRRRSAGVPAVDLEEWARRLDEVSAVLEVPIRFISMDWWRDSPLHREISQRMRRPSEVARPSPYDLVSEFSRARVVIGARFHAVVMGVMAGRPVVALGYAPKVVDLAKAVPELVNLLPYGATPHTSLVAQAIRTASTREVTTPGRGQLRVAARRQRVALARFAERLAT